MQRCHLLGQMGALALLALAACGQGAGERTGPVGGGPVEQLQPGAPAPDVYLVGSGVYDVTGPAAELGMMGYAMVQQQTAGIHMRLRSRAFVIADPAHPSNRVVFVSADLGQIFQAVKQEVIQKLQARFGPTLYTDQNVLLSATRTHAGPGGFSSYTLYDLTTFGFSKQNFEAITEGIFQSIVRADASLRPATILLNEGDLQGVSINRSEVAYLANPSSERARYADDTDKKMTLLRIDATDGTPIGMVNWFAVHGTSMHNTNRYISSDNKGYAEALFERWKGTNYAADSTFVGAFAQSNEGDSSPDILKDVDGDGDWDGVGGKDEFKSTRVSGAAQYERARDLYEDASSGVHGPIDFRHSFVDMSHVSIAQPDGSVRQTCYAAIGISMIAGAEDGPGFGREGITCDDSLLGGFLCASPLVDACHAEKPIVLASGKMKPYPWTPEVLPVQVLRIGNLALVAVPAEFTTMSGRRLREMVSAILAPVGVDHVVIAGLSNAYAGYVTTREEYALQEYEGASTHFGPWTLLAYQQEFARIATDLATGAPSAAGPTPRDLRQGLIEAQPGVVFDAPPIGKHFGDVALDALASYRAGDTVRVQFWGGHPKNDLMTQKSYLEVQRLDGTQWVAVAHDWDPETKFHWERSGIAASLITVEWEIPPGTLGGQYRIVHQGAAKDLWSQAISHYSGRSSAFTVAATTSP